jgi:dethiobiotin synthetase
VSVRPTRLVVVTGTGTEVGKTWFAAAVARALGAGGRTVAARKPVQSFEPGAGPTDADVLAAATGEHPDAVCPSHRRYEVPMAPPMAAARLGRPPFTIADLVAETSWPAGVDVGLVEGAGGPRSPLAADGDTVDLCAALRPDLVVLVADAGLGTINAVRLCAAALAPHPLAVALNRYDDADALHHANRAWIADRDGLETVASPEAVGVLLA